MATKSSLPLALGLAGLGSLYVFSGIKGGSLADAFHGTTPSSAQQSETTPAQDAIDGESGSATTSANSYPGHVEAANPLAVGGLVGNARKREQLGAQLEQGLQYKEYLEGEVRAGKMTQATANQTFSTHFPNYAKWASELRSLL